jgi:hypothetical protein
MRPLLSGAGAASPAVSRLGPSGRVRAAAMRDLCLKIRVAE